MYIRPVHHFYSDAPNARELYMRTGRLLRSIGIYPGVKGYEYLRCAIIITYHNPEAPEYITKTLYPRVAKLCGADSFANVGRSCRRTLEAAFKLGGPLCDYYKGNKPPKCGRFITDAAKYLLENERVVFDDIDSFII